MVGATADLLVAMHLGLDWGGYSGSIRILSLRKEAGSEERMKAR